MAADVKSAPTLRLIGGARYASEHGFLRIHHYPASAGLVSKSIVDAGAAASNLDTLSWEIEW